MYHKNYNYLHYQKWKHINRKKRILKAYAPDGIPHEFDSQDIFEERISAEEKSRRMSHHDYGCYLPYYKYAHENCLNKGKIHCSCPLCSFKGSPMQDIRQYQRMYDELRDSDYSFGPQESELKKLINNIAY